MKISLKILFFFAFILSFASVRAQVLPEQATTRESTVDRKESAVDAKIAGLDEEDRKQPGNDTDKKKDQVKQVRSAKMDMSRARGARPPDIVRPAGSRIPKGVGRPAGAGRRSR